LTVAAQKDPESSRKGSTKRRAKAPAVGLEREFERQGPLEIGEAVVDIGCPDCRGVLAVREHGKHHWLAFRCRIGHAFAADSLIMAKTAQIEQSLESALAALEEIAQVYVVLGARASAGSDLQFGQKAREARRRITAIQSLLHRAPMRRRRKHA
jgi:hypothetical protein